MEIRNVAVIAHVDHGKTTLVDQMLKQSGTLKELVEERVLDSNELERERGITILSKNTAILYKNYKINIIDTPGHADFGGEVERVLKMVDGVLLLVDAQEGVMPQTKFVVKKALEAGLKPIVVLNKVDKPAAEPDRVIDEVFDLFVSFEATDEQLDFPVIYTSAKLGFARYDLEDKNGDLTPLFETIVKHTPPPSGSKEEPLQMQIFTLDYDNYVGRIGIARIFNGEAKRGDEVVLVEQKTGNVQKGRITKLFTFKGLERLEVDRAPAGDIVAVAGFEDVEIGDTIASPENPVPLPPLHIEEPTISVFISVNDSPLAGTEGEHVTATKLKNRLQKEMRTNVAMKFEEIGEGKFKVSGRGELQIAILAETLRREGFEFSISRPEVVVKEEEGEKLEPFELLVVEVPDEYTGAVIEELGRRKGELLSMNKSGDGRTRLEFVIPSRGLIGYRSKFLTDTKGEGIMASSFLDFRKFSGKPYRRKNGAIVSVENGEATAYSLGYIQERGKLFIKPGDKVYRGMVIGEHNREGDLDVNPVRGKKLTNVRAAGSDENVKLAPPVEMSLERALEWIEEDELVEVTPLSIRIRKKFLNPNDRKRYQKRTVS
ncbi:GTP-binding protein [Balnearium lithotrophicum]|uniref:Large ribosomal subunit assembly factor BipA n=1 Tax=Balnearium lithotrophicum TaxID=223788 RepID=A0A521BPX7_9BACT|nr:translational GTPase TypA [Balnearium lithotrophicum]SMO48610.1 GTP-binding protein [Balnearium lithotrophicum]